MTVLVNPVINSGAIMASAVLWLFAGCKLFHYYLWEPNQASGQLYVLLPVL